MGSHRGSLINMRTSIKPCTAKGGAFALVWYESCGPQSRRSRTLKLSGQFEGLVEQMVRERLTQPARAIQVRH